MIKEKGLKKLKEEMKERKGRIERRKGSKNDGRKKGCKEGIGKEKDVKKER